MVNLVNSQLLDEQFLSAPLRPLSTNEAFEIIPSGKTRRIRLHWSSFKLEDIHGVNLSFVGKDERNYSKLTLNHYLDFNDVSNNEERFQLFSHNEVMKIIF